MLQASDGESGACWVKIPDTVWAAFEDRKQVNDVEISSPDRVSEQVLYTGCGDCMSWEADITFSEGTRRFGVRLYENPDTEQSYQFAFQCNENRYVFEKYPNWPWFTCMNIGLERPIELMPGRKYHVQIIADDTIATIYVDGVALNTRMYDKQGDAISVFCDEGSIKVKNISYSETLAE